MANKKRSSGKTKSNAQRSSQRPRSSRDPQKRQAAYRKRQRQKWLIRIITILIAIALVVTFVLSVGSCNRNQEPQEGSGLTEPVKTGEDESETEPDVDTASKKVTLTAVGDIIAHDTILELAKTGDSYDFSSLFAPLKADISRMDLAICNVETPLGGGPYIGYPNFNTPDEMGLAVIDTGFDVALQASNHSMDSGADGVHHGIDFWKAHADEILMTGLHDSAEAEKEIPIIEKNGIRFAVLNYTYGLNGYELPGDEPYLITIMNDENREFISNQVKEAKEKADFVIVCPHWGEENQVGEPTEFQTDWAKTFADAGADLILGTHPHVLEKIEWVDGEGGGRTLCYYSLGNFVSNQQYTDLVLGAMAYLEIEMKDGKASIVEDSVKAIPVVTHNDKTGSPVKIATYYLADYTEEQAAVHDTKLSFDPEFSLDLLKQKSQSVLGSYAADRLP